MNCIPITNKIRELAKEFPGESERTIANLVGIWQAEDPNNRVEKYPTISEIKALIKKLRGAPQTPQNITTKPQITPSYYEGDIKPEKNTIFVFGSNPEGRHGAGAAKIAREQFGAKYGVGEGMTGNAYALPTKDLSVKFTPFGKDDTANEPLKEGVYNVYYDVKRSTSDNPVSYLIKKIKDNKVTYVETYIGEVNGQMDDIEVPNSEKTVTEAEFRAITGRDKESFTYSNSYGFAEVHYTGKRTTDGHGIYSIEINILDDENQGKGIGSKMYEDIIDKLAEQGDYITPGNVVETNHKWEALQKQGRTKEVTLENGEHILVAIPKNRITQNRNYQLKSISEKTIIENIKELYRVARQNPNKQFKVAYRNTDKASLNGYTGLEMIDMFLKAGNIPSNIVFSKEWIDTGKFNSPNTSSEDVAEDIQTTSVHNGRTTIQYTPKGKQRQTYTIVGNKIYNKEGKEVFKTDSVDRNRIFANLAVQQGRAVVVEYRNAKYVVNNREQIISVTTGKMMQWEEGNGDRKQILREAYHKLKVLQNKQSTAQTFGKTTSGLVIVPSNQTSYRAKTTGGIDTLRHPDKNGMHFGNPFATRDAGGVRKVMPNTREAVIAYEQWLRGEEYQDVEPQRRQWILDQIESGNLDNRDLIYYTNKVPDDSYGRDTYDYYEAPNHAHILQKLIAESMERRQQEKAAKEVAEKNKARITNEAFNTPEVVTVAEMAAADLTFDPKTRRDRITMIANWFSGIVDSWIEEQTKPIKNQISAINKEIMENPNLSKEDRDKLNTQIYDLEGQINSLDRKTAIDTMKPSGIFNKIKSIIENTINDTDEGRINAELANLNKMKGIEKYTEEQKLKAAKKKADYKLQEYRKILDNFRALADESCTIIRKAESLVIDINAQAASEDINLNDDDPEGNAAIDGMADDSTKEESYKDGWMTNYKHVSSHESLSQATRKVIMKIPKLDYRGKYEKDDLGNNRYLDADYVHATLIDKLRFMITAEDMIPMLTDLARTKPWVKQIIKKLQSDDVLFSQFYQDFRKDFVQYWIQKKINNADGTFSVQTICLNKPEGIYYLLDSWRDNYETSTLLDDDSIYNKNGSLNKENAKKGLELVKELTNAFNSMSKEEIMNKVQEEEILNKISKLLHMIGANPDPTIVKIALANDKSTEKITYTAPILQLLPELNTIFKGVLRGEVESRAEKRENTEEDTETRADLINTFSKAYSAIATMFAEVTEDAIESSVRENGKSFYSHLTPSYLGKTIKELKDVRNDPEKFEQYIQREFKQYDWFYKNGEWRSDWVKRLATDPNARKMLDHKVVLNYDKVEYYKWDALDYTIVLINEFLADPTKKTAWYALPILSDAPSAEFIKFIRYTDGTEIDEDGNKLSYKESIINKMVDLVNQEYDRIMLVRERAELIKKGVIKPIKNFDIDGSKGEKGDKFKFLPQLNSITYKNGKTFMQEFERLRQGSPSDFRHFLKETIRDVMDQGFKDAYATWVEQGLLDELPNGKYKNLPFTGVAKSNERLTKALQSAKTLIQENTNEAQTGNLIKSIDNLIKAISDKKVLNEQQVNEFLNTVKSLLNDIAAHNSNIKNINTIKNLLVATHNAAQEELENYYWNSTFATSQIIEITTTDLAYYKGVEDFQKRYKEVHAPSLRLNTQATFHGKPIGRTWERTIYLRDEIIISEVLKDVEAVFDEQVKKGRITKPERDYIISQFKKVNVADAQAYRSLSSYRSMMGMMGQWTDQMEHAYQNLKNNKWSMEDFNIIWQTKKPFVYTQINNESGVANHSGIKTPVQHKNSEYLLLAVYDAISNAVGRSSKLKAINDFMEEDNQVDVVQFESTTKVGGQGIIDLSGTTGYEDTMRVLREETGIAAGKENPSVIHSVSYEDYGIQTATPEHAIDAVQLVGTQIRKLITADISPNAKIEINGVVRTKQEWLDFYNEINTENIIDSFREVDEIFSDPKQIEKRLLEEIKGSTRYSRDLIAACTLDKTTGNFNIPLYDPVQSQRVQQLLNSIIKSTITKQKIKGGALIQVSCYGLSEDLHIEFEGEGENKRIKYLECYMPAYSKKFYEPLMDKNGVLDVNKLPEDLRRLIGYRVPTESKYSMAPLRIKGFLPQQTGSAIMLPAEITTLSGSD